MLYGTYRWCQAPGQMSYFHHRGSEAFTALGLPLTYPSHPITNSLKTVKETAPSLALSPDTHKVLWRVCTGGAVLPAASGLSSDTSRQQGLRSRFMAVSTQQAGPAGAAASGITKPSDEGAGWGGGACLHRSLPHPGL